MPLAYSVVPSNQFSIIQTDYRPYIHRCQTQWNCSITSECSFSTASGGFGSRINYDHKISPHTRFTASPEFLTYSLSRASTILGDLMPPGITRITLIAIPIGLQPPLCAHIAYQSPCWIWFWPHYPPGSPLTPTGVLRE